VYIYYAYVILNIGRFTIKGVTSGKARVLSKESLLTHGFFILVKAK
jgi:hypothetical protein